MKQLDRIEGGDVAISTDGEKHPVKLISAVDKRQSNEVQVPQPNEAQRRKRREALEKLAETIKELVPAGRRKALTTLGRELNAVSPGWRDEFLRPLRLGREGGPGGALRTVLELFEDLFVLSGQGTSANMYVELR